MTRQKMYFRMISASLVRRRSRMVVALLAVMIGAAILSGLLTIYIDVPRQMGAQFRSYGANMILTPVLDSLSKDDISECTSMIPESDVVGVAPYRYDTVRINERPVMAAGTDMEGAKKTSPFWAVDGSWPGKEGEIMVGKKIAELYRFKLGDELTAVYTSEAEGNDEELVDNEMTFVITGFLDTGGNEEEYVFMSVSDLSSLTGIDEVYDVCELSVSANEEKLNGYADAINEAGTAAKARLVKRVTQSETAVLGKLQALVLLVTVIVLALTMICVATTMTAVVTERRKEIGLRKALGASDNSIITEFMGEGVLLGAIGGIAGAILGFLFAQAVSVSVFNSSISFRFLLLPLTMIVSVLVTAVSGLLPIKSATAVDPALVLKGE